MNAEEISEDFQQLLTSLQQSHLTEVSSMQQKYQEEKERLEARNREEMSRLHLQALQLNAQNGQLDAESRRQKEKYERELRQMTEKHEKEEAKLRDECNKMYQESVNLRTTNAAQERNELSRGLNSALEAQVNVGQRDDIRNFQNILLGVQDSWNDVKYCYERELKPSLDNSEKEDALDSIENMKRYKRTFNGKLTDAIGSLGRLRVIVTQDCFDSVNATLRDLQTNRFECGTLDNLKRAIRSGKNVSIEEMEVAIEGCNQKVTSLFENPLTVRNV